jgi:DNA-binding transcriptional LysR family regulator
MMDRFEALTAFVAVGDQLGFASAARALGTSPSGITRAVAALERHLGVTLFHRSTRAVSLTDEGLAFLERARRVLADLREAEQVAMGGRSVPRGQLHITAPVLFGRLHVLPVIEALLVQHERLTARMMLIDRDVRIVEEGIDVAVRIGVLADSALLGETYTIADIVLVPTIVRMDDLELSHIWQDLPRISQWFDRIRSRPSFNTAYVEGSRVDPASYVITQANRASA